MFCSVSPLFTMKDLPLSMSVCKCYSICDLFPFDFGTRFDLIRLFWCESWFCMASLLYSSFDLSEGFGITPAFDSSGLFSRDDFYVLRQRSCFNSIEFVYGKESLFSCLSSVLIPITLFPRSMMDLTGSIDGSYYILVCSKVYFYLFGVI